VLSLTPCLAQQHTTRTAAAPAVSLQTLISVIAVEDKASNTVNDWSSLKQTGLTFSIKGNDRCSNAKVLRYYSSFGRVSVCYSGTQNGPTKLTLSKEMAKVERDQSYISHDQPVEDLKKALGPETQVMPIRGACPDDGVMMGTSISSITIKGKKPIYAYSMDSEGASGGFSDQLTITLNRDLDKDPMYKCE
jgi:hypothetical protein